MNEESRRYQDDQNAFMQKAQGYLRKVQNGRSVRAKDPLGPEYSQTADDARLAKVAGLGEYVQQGPPAPATSPRPSSASGRRYTTQELDAMDAAEQAAIDQGMNPAAAKDAAATMRGGQGFMEGMTGSLTRTGLGIKQAGTYLSGTDEDRVKVNEEIRAHEAQMANQDPSGKIGEMVGTAAQFAGPQAVGSVIGKLAPKFVTQAARLYLGQPGSVLRSAGQGVAYEATQPVMPSDADTSEYLMGKSGRISMGAGAGATAGLVGKFATREGVPTPLNRQPMMMQAQRLGIEQHLTPAMRTGDETLSKLELGFRSKAGSEGQFAAKDRALQAALEQQGTKAIGSTAVSPTESVLAQQWQEALKGYEPIKNIKNMSIDAQYFDALHALAQDQVAAVANPTAVAMAKKLLRTAHKMTGDDLLGQTQKMRTAGFKARETDPPKADVYNDLAKIMEDYTERRVGYLASKGTLPKDAMEKFRQSRTELSKIRAIEESVDPVSGKMTASRYLKGVYNRSPAHAGPGASPTATGLQDVTDTAKVMQQARPELSNMGNLMTGRELQSAATGPFSALVHMGPIAKNYLAAKYYLKYGGKPGMLGNALTPTQNAYVRRMLPGVGFAAQEGLTE
jgi:hypothetical protein